MKRTLMLVAASLILLALAAGCAASPTAAPSPGGNSKLESYLSVQEVEQLTGITGLTRTVQTVSLMFKNQAGEVVYQADFRGLDFYDDEVDMDDGHYAEVSGVGDRAAVALPDAPYRLTFAVGDSSVMTQTLARDAQNNVLLTKEQLIALAKRIITNMGK